MTSTAPRALPAVLDDPLVAWSVLALVFGVLAGSVFAGFVWWVKAHG